MSPFSRCEAAFLETQTKPVPVWASTHQQPGTLLNRDQTPRNWRNTTRSSGVMRLSSATFRQLLKFFCGNLRIS